MCYTKMLHIATLKPMQVIDFYTITAEFSESLLLRRNYLALIALNRKPRQHVS